MWAQISSLCTGWLVDLDKDFGACFYLSGLVLIISGVFVVLVDRLVERKKASPSDTELEATQAFAYKMGVKLVVSESNCK